MSHELESPVQMAVSAFKGSVNGEYCKNSEMRRTLSGRRRVFVQTETGSVFGIELDRRDNAQTVKRTLQLALNIPTEQKSLTYGDMVLKNDMSIVRNDSPLLLTRNLMHRSSSSPCLSPRAKDIQQKDNSCPIEILGYSNHFSGIKNVMKEIMKAMELGIDPIPIPSGLGGAYYFRDCNGDNCVIVKPTDEEPYAPNNPKGFVGKTLGQPGLKRSVRVGETGFREVAAYLLDHDHFANVPPTALAKVAHSIFNLNDEINGMKPWDGVRISKIASIQQFIVHDFDASDYGTSSFPVSAIHRIGILDIRILNTDRHAGNLLVRKLDAVDGLGQVELFPIDHGLSLPENLEDPYFEWIHWPQASIPFSEEELEYISNLDPFRDCEMLRMELPMIREACLRVLVLCTIFLKEATGFGLCLADIGEMMSREFRCNEEEPSELELICIETKRLVGEQDTHSESSESACNLFDIDYEEPELNLDMQASASKIEKNSNGGILKLDVSGRKEQLESKANVMPPRPFKLSVSTKDLGARDRRRSGYLSGISSGNGLINEQPHGSGTFVKLGDMEEVEWLQFLEVFQKLLVPAFEKRKSIETGQKQRQRLGTSCQF